jgi:outer membrane protein TolC
MPHRPAFPAFTVTRPLTATALAAALAMFIAGCAVGPDYQRPTTTVPASYKEAPEGWKVAEPADQTDRGTWWTVYNDERLNELETRLNQSNQSIAQFAAAYRQARALVSEARAAYFPTIGAAASAARSGTGAGNRSTNSSSFGQQGSVNNQFSLSLDASWEPDLWGSVSRTVTAQKAGQQGAAADLANARLSAQATLAQSYFQLRSLDAQQKLLDETVAAYEQSLKLTQNQYAQGIVARTDVIQAPTP